MLDLDALMQQAANLIRELFSLHYVGLFLIDEASAEAGEQRVILRAGTGETGRRMAAQGYRLDVDDTSAIGQCVKNAQVRISPALNAAPPENLVEVDPELPGSRSEMALPMCSRDRVLGALDVHSAERDAFSEEDVSILQMVANQIAVAVDNARRFAEIRTQLQEAETRQSHHARGHWVDSESWRTAPRYERTQPGLTPIDETDIPGSVRALDQIIDRALAQQEVITQPDTGNGAGQAALVAPIKLRGETIGTLGLHDTEGGRRWTDDEIALIEDVVAQMALAIENARLLGETQGRAERERLTADISARVRASADVDTILRTAIRELGRALRASDGLIRLEVSDAAGLPQSDKEEVEDENSNA